MLRMYSTGLPFLLNSLLVSIAAYQLIFGWLFSIGFVLLLLLHEGLVDPDPLERDVASQHVTPERTAIAGRAERRGDKRGGGSGRNERPEKCDPEHQQGERGADLSPASTQGASQHPDGAAPACPLEPRAPGLGFSHRASLRRGVSSNTMASVVTLRMT